MTNALVMAVRALQGPGIELWQGDEFMSVSRHRFQNEHATFVAFISFSSGVVPLCSVTGVTEQADLRCFASSVCTQV